MKKKGSHVGVMLSFVIFITFLIFLYSIMSPSTQVQREKRTVLSNLEFNLEKEFESNFTGTIITIDDTINKECVSFQNVIPDLEDDADLLITDSQGIVRNYSVSGQSLVVYVGSPSLFDGFLKLGYSGELGPSPEYLGVPACTPITQINLESMQQIESSFESKISDALNEYELEYETLKKELGVPENNEFNFMFIYENGTQIGELNTDPATTIYVDEITIEYMNNAGEINFGTLVVQVW